MNTLLEWAQSHLIVAAAAAGLLLAGLVWLARTVGKAADWPPVAVVVASLAAMACTAYSADTSWRFAEHQLGMTSAKERAAMFAAAELALFASALMARQNLRSPQGAPGTPGLLVWLITGVQVIPAYAESGFIGGTVRAVVGPVMAALLWHLAMGIELRHSKPDADSQSLPALLAREGRERLLSRLGLAVRDRSAEQITRDRWTVKAVGLAAKLAQSKPGRGKARLERRLSVAVGKAQAGADEEQRAKLLELLAARRHSAALATIDLPSPWQPVPELVEDAVTVERIAAEPEVYPALEAPVPAAVPGGYPDPSNAVPAGAARLPLFTRCGLPPTPSMFPKPSPVPAAEYPRTRPQVHAEYVPDPPSEDWQIPGGANGNPTEPVEDDEPVYPDPLIPQVQADFPDEMPGVKRLKEKYGIGQARAQRIRDELTGVTA